MTTIEQKALELYPEGDHIGEEIINAQRREDFLAGANYALELAAERVCVIFDGEDDVPQNWGGSARNNVEDRPVIASKQSILELKTHSK